MVVPNAEQPAGNAGAQDSLSVEDRIANIFAGGPKAAPKAQPKGEPKQAKAAEPQDEAPQETDEQAASEEAATPEATAEPETFELEVDGEKFTLPKKLEKSVSQERDYTQKSQELAHQRRAFETMNEQAKSFQIRQQFEQSIAQELQQLSAFDAVLNQPIDPNGLSSDDIARTMLQRSEWQRQRDAIARSVDGKAQEFQQKAAKADAEYKAKAKEVLEKRIPGWNEDLWKSIREHAKVDGYTDSELGSINDPRHQVTLWKAQQYDTLRAKATKTVTEAKSVKTTPANPMPQHVKDKLAFNKQVSKFTPGSPEHQRLVRDRVSKIFG